MTVLRLLVVYCYEARLLLLLSLSVFFTVHTSSAAAAQPTDSPYIQHNNTRRTNQPPTTDRSVDVGCTLRRSTTSQDNDTTRHEPDTARHTTTVPAAPSPSGPSHRSCVKWRSANSPVLPRTHSTPLLPSFHNRSQSFLISHQHASAAHYGKPLSSVCRLFVPPISTVTSPSPYRVDS